MKIRPNHMPVTICAFGQVAACFDPFFQAAADGDEAALLLAAVVEAVPAIAVFGGIAFEAVVSVRVGAHGEFLLEMSFDVKCSQRQKKGQITQLF